MTSNKNWCVWCSVFSVVRGKWVWFRLRDSDWKYASCYKTRKAACERRNMNMAFWGHSESRYQILRIGQKPKNGKTKKMV
jgi:hypothetical protein